MTASLLAFGSCLWEFCPCGLHSVISRLLAGGSLGFRVVPLLLHGSQITDGIFAVLLFRSCFPLPYQSLRWYNVIISSCMFQMPVNWSADHRPCWFFVLFFDAWVFGVLFSLVFLVFALLVCTLTDQWIVYRSYSVLFHWHIVVMIDVVTALIRWICKMHLSFRLDKRSGESHLALDGKKDLNIFKPILEQCMWTVRKSF